MGVYNIIRVKEDATKLITKKIKSGDPDKYIHCIWYCVSETRFHTDEQDCLRELMLSYHKNTIPIIIVYGKAVDIKIKNQMINEIKKFIEQYKNQNLEVISILAKEMANVKPYGTKLLLETTLKKLERALESSCYEGMRKEKLKQFQEEFNRNLNIAEDEEEKGKNKQKEKELDDKQFSELFIKKLSKILKIKFKENNLARLSSYLLKKYRDLMQEFDNKMNDFVVVYADQLFTRYHAEYKNLDLKNGSQILKLFDTSFYDMAKLLIRSKLENEIKNDVLPRILKEIKVNLLDNFTNMINDIFDSIILENESILEELKKQVDEIVKTSYRDIHKKIDNCLKKYSDSYKDDYDEENKKPEEKIETNENKDQNMFLNGII